MVAGAPASLADVKRQVVAGELFNASSPREILVHEYLLYKFGIADDADVAAAIGQKIRLEYRPRASSLAGVVEITSGGDDGLTLDEAKLLDEAISRLAKSAEDLNLNTEEAAFSKRPSVGHQPPKRRRPRLCSARNSRSPACSER